MPVGRRSAETLGVGEGQGGDAVVVITGRGAVRNGPLLRHIELVALHLVGEDLPRARSADLGHLDGEAEAVDQRDPCRVREFDRNDAPLVDRRQVVVDRITDTGCVQHQRCPPLVAERRDAFLLDRPAAQRRFPFARHAQKTAPFCQRRKGAFQKGAVFGRTLTPGAQ